MPNDIVFGDERASVLFGLNPLAAARGLPLLAWTSRIHPDDQTRVSAEIGRTLRGETVFSVPYRTRRSDDQYRWLHAKGRCISDEDGRPLRYPGYLIDVSQPDRDGLREVERALSVEIVRELLVSSRLASLDLDNALLTHLIDVALHRMSDVDLREPIKPSQLN